MMEKMYRIEQGDGLVEEVLVPADEKNEVELFVLENVVELLNAMLKRMRWIALSKKNVFSPNMMKELKRIDADERILEFVNGAVEFQKEMTFMAEMMIEQMEEYRNIVAEVREEKVKKQEEELKLWELMIEMDLEMLEENRRRMMIREMNEQKRPLRCR